MKRLALLALLLATPAMAQDAPVETVTVNGNSLVGVWHGSMVQSQFWQGLLGALTRVGPPAFGQMAEAFCRIAAAKDELEMLCLQFGSNGRVTIEDGLVRIGNSRTVFHGELVDSNRLRGHFRHSSWLGIARENPTVAEAVRIAPPENAPDTSGKAPLLRRILEQGLAGMPQDSDAMKKNGSIFLLPDLGAVQSLSYLGQETKWDWPPPPGATQDIMNIPSRPGFFSVYLVRFAQGKRICGLHQRDDGALDAFRCV
jgi:hypothetical protein